MTSWKQDVRFPPSLGGVDFKVRPVIEMLRTNTYELRLYGSTADGWYVMLCKGGAEREHGLQISPMFYRDFGDTRRDCINACERAYGRKPTIHTSK